MVHRITEMTICYGAFMVNFSVPRSRCFKTIILWTNDKSELLHYDRRRSDPNKCPLADDKWSFVVATEKRWRSPLAISFVWQLKGRMDGEFILHSLHGIRYFNGQVVSGIIIMGIPRMFVNCNLCWDFRAGHTSTAHLTKGESVFMTYVLMKMLLFCDMNEETSRLSYEQLY